MSVHGELGPISQLFKRHIPFADNAGFKDAKGNGINITLYEGRTLVPCQPEFYEMARRAEVRPDDVFVCGFVKTGCHWVWETMSMIMKGKGEYSRLGKPEADLEVVSPELYKDLPSPRILNTHMEFNWLPEKVREYKNKIVLTTRNPKDVAVSLYNHHIVLPELYNYKGEFRDWFQLYLDGKLDNGNFADYYLLWEKAIQDNPDHPILVLKYEDSIRDFPGTVRRLAEFLDKSLTEEQVQDIVNAAGFNPMKKGYEDKPSVVLLRKGQVGDWRHWLTVAESEELDVWCERLEGTHFEPTLVL